MRIDVSANQIEFPPVCPCCDGPRPGTHLPIRATRVSGKKSIRTQTNVWDVPYCGQCVHHVRLAERAWLLSLCLGGFSIVAGVGLSSLTPFVGVPAGVLGAALAVFAHLKPMSQAQTGCGPRCVCVGKAISYCSWHGTLHKFEVVSNAYAGAFLVANQRKVVNLTQEAIQLLAARGCAPTQRALRTPRRYRP